MKTHFYSKIAALCTAAAIALSVPTAVFAEGLTDQIPESNVGSVSDIQDAVDNQQVENDQSADAPEAAVPDVQQAPDATDPSANAAPESEDITKIDTSNVKTDDLKAKIEKTEKLDKTAYVDFSAVDTALTQAKDLLASGVYDQTAVDYALHTLQKAVKELVPVPTEAPTESLAETPDNSDAEPADSEPVEDGTDSLTAPSDEPAVLEAPDVTQAPETETAAPEATDDPVTENVPAEDVPTDDTGSEDDASTPAVNPGETVVEHLSEEIDPVEPLVEEEPVEDSQPVKEPKVEQPVEQNNAEVSEESGSAEEETAVGDILGHYRWPFPNLEKPDDSVPALPLTPAKPSASPVPCTPDFYSSYEEFRSAMFYYSAYKDMADGFVEHFDANLVPFFGNVSDDSDVSKFCEDYRRWYFWNNWLDWANSKDDTDSGTDSVPSTPLFPSIPNTNLTQDWLEWTCWQKLMDKAEETGNSKYLEWMLWHYYYGKYFNNNSSSGSDTETKPGTDSIPSTPLTPAQPSEKVQEWLKWSAWIKRAESKKAESDDNLTKMVDDVVRGSNVARKDAGKKELTVSSELTSAAQIRAKELAKKLSHTRPDGSSCFTVSEAVNGENILSGNNGDADTAAEVLNTLMNTSNYKDNILNSGHTTIGVAVYHDTATSTYYWVQLFGTGSNTI